MTVFGPRRLPGCPGICGLVAWLAARFAAVKCWLRVLLGVGEKADAVAGDEGDAGVGVPQGAVVQHRDRETTRRQAISPRPGCGRRASRDGDLRTWKPPSVVDRRWRSSCGLTSLKSSVAIAASTRPRPEEIYPVEAIEPTAASSPAAGSPPTRNTGEKRTNSSPTSKNASYPPAPAPAPLGTPCIHEHVPLTEAAARP